MDGSFHSRIAALIIMSDKKAELLPTERLTLTCLHVVHALEERTLGLRGGG
jgi:hypothetical protein